jgi:hypothetical protein
VVGGSVESLVKVVEALRQAGIELIGEGEISQGQGRGVRLVNRRAEGAPR